MENLIQLQPHGTEPSGRETFAPRPQIRVEASAARIDYELGKKDGSRYEAFWKERAVLPADLFTNNPRVWFEIGAGTGHFFSELALHYPDVQLLALERCRHRARRLVNKSVRLGRKNFVGLRGNAIPTMMHSIPDGSLERLYILYPAPWPKNTHRKHRWHLSPVMPHLFRALKPGGLLIWASDQKSYIDEAKYVCEAKYPSEILSYGELKPNEWNDMNKINEGRGRTKFESDFIAQSLPCYELVVRKC